MALEGQLRDRVTYDNSVYTKIDKRLSKVQEYQKSYPSLTCVIKAKVVEENWSCCPTLWKPFQSSCYFISTELLFWDDSQKNCYMMGSDLMVINTKDEQDFIIQNLNAEAAYYVEWSDPKGWRLWQWVDQTPYNKTAIFWHKDDSNDPDERCVAINFPPKTRKWGWNDVHCHVPLKSICKMMKIYL